VILALARRLRSILSFLNVQLPRVLIEASCRTLPAIPLAWEDAVGFP
jgi:hypothetical protein